MLDALSVTEVTDPEEFEALRGEWNELIGVDERATVFQTWEVQYHLWRLSAARVRPCILLLRNGGGRLQGCAPFGTWRWGVGPVSARVLGFVTPRGCDYCSVILDPRNAAQVLATIGSWLQANLHRWDVVRLGPVREDSWLFPGTAGLGGLSGACARVRSSNVAPYLTLASGWSSYTNGLSASRAGTVRRKVRKLLRDSAGGLCTATGGDALEAAVNELFRLHQERMSEKRQRGAFAVRRDRDAYRGLIKALAAVGRAQVDTISVDGVTVAALCAFQFRGTVSFYQSGFASGYGHLSPGVVMHALRIEEAIRAGATEYDFLIGDETYKSFWATGRRRLYTVDFATGSWRRMLFGWWTALRRRLSRWSLLRAAYLRLRRPESESRK